MKELDDYGSFNTSYEGVGQLWYVGKPNIPVCFDVRQLADGRLIVGCVSASVPIEPDPVSITGYLLSGEPFDTIWGRGITEIYRQDGNVKTAHYLATMTRVRYTKDLQPNNHSIEFALHNFIPGNASERTAKEIEFTFHGHSFSIYPAQNYSQQTDELLRYRGNLRTSWVKTKFVQDSEQGRVLWGDLDEMISGLVNALSLATGTLVTSPQRITFDPNRDRNDVEHYASDAKPFSPFIPHQGWDMPITSTINAWFSGAWPVSTFGTPELSVWIRQHLDACARELYLETRALAAATLLDVMAGRYCPVWTTQLPKDVSFKNKLTTLLRAIGITLPETKLISVIKARNSLVHAGTFVTTESDASFTEYKNLVRLGRSMLLRLIGLPSTLHESIEV